MIGKKPAYGRVVASWAGTSPPMGDPKEDAVTSKPRLNCKPFIIFSIVG